MQSTEIRKRRIPELDGLRGLAIILVLVGHTLTFTLKSLSYVGLKMAETGVLIFFVLSGYLITGLLLEEASRTGTISLWGFYRRRIFRLFPALAVFLIAILFLSWMGVVTDVTGVDIAAAILYVRNIFGRGESLAHLWSLSLEEQFYTLWPFLFLSIGAPRMRRVAIGLCILVMGYRGISIAMHPEVYDTGVFYLRPWFRFDAIAIGCFLALTPLPKLPKWFAGASALVLAVWSVYGESLSRVLFISVQTILAAALLVGVIQGAQLTRAVFSMAWLRWFGAVSYSLYLWQQIFTVSDTGFGWLREFPWNIIAAIGVATASRKLVEEPFLALAHRTGPRSARTGTARTASPTKAGNPVPQD